MIHEIINNSMGKANISMSEEAWGYTTKLRSWMFENVYNDASTAKLEENKARRVIKELFLFYCDLLDKKSICPKEKIERVVTDYISGMTDRYAVERYKENFIPMGLKCSARDDNLFKLASSEAQ
jgi:dGTPase